MKKVFSFAVVLILAVFAQLSFAAWDGSVKIPKVVGSGESSYYEITSPEELIGFLDSVIVAHNSNMDIRAYLKNDIVFGSDTSKLCSRRWNRSTVQGAFGGEFDGRGHTIYGLNAEKSLFESIVRQRMEGVHDLNIANSSFGSDSVLVAATIVNTLKSVVKNVNVYNTDIQGVESAGGIAVSVVASAADPAMILNSNVVGGSVGASIKAGGIAATASGNILGCSNSAKVYNKANPSESLYGNGREVYFGGIVGQSRVLNGVAMASCVNRGKVEVDLSYRIAYVGGIVGNLVGNVENLQNYGDVSSKVVVVGSTVAAAGFMASYSISYVGGVIGRHVNEQDITKITTHLDLKDLLNSGKVSAMYQSSERSVGLYVGGILGSSAYASVINALNLGSIDARGDAKELFLNVGGVMGEALTAYKDEVFTMFKNRGNITAEGTFQTLVGGIVGRMSYWSRPTIYNGFALEKSFNYGNVTGITSDTATSSDSLHVGGLVGNAYMARIADSYNHGRVEAKGKLARGVSCAGGIAGIADNLLWYLNNVYSAAPEVKGDAVGGIIGYARNMRQEETVFYDGTLANIAPFGVACDTTALAGIKKTTAELQSDTMVTFFNTSGGTEDDRKIWTRYGGYPVLVSDGLYKNDSLFFDQDTYEMPAVRLEGDTLHYTISTAGELKTFLQQGRTFDSKKFYVELAKDIVMGKDPNYLMNRIMSIDTSGACFNMVFDGKGHTIYGLNLTTAMFFCLDTSAVVQNLTIANSRFANDKGLPAASVAIENSGTIKNVTVRKSFVRGGFRTGGIVAYNYHIFPGTLMDVKNENTSVMGGIGGGIAGESTGPILNASNSGRVEASRAGGIVGNTYDSGKKMNVVKGCSNTGFVYASGYSWTEAGGIVGGGSRMVLRNNRNTGVVQASSKNVADYKSAAVVGGIAGYLNVVDSLSDVGNWGPVHGLSADTVYAGGLVGYMRGADSSRSAITESYNYGPVNVKATVAFSVAGGLVGKLQGTNIKNSYNRALVKNNDASAMSYAGGIAALTEGLSLTMSYSYTETLSGKNAGAILYSYEGQNNTLDGLYYGDGVKAPAVASASSHSSNKSQNITATTFEKLKTEHGYLTDDSWVFGNCLPRMKSDTTSGCAVNAVADPDNVYVLSYPLGFTEDVVYAGAGSHGGDIVPVKMKPAVMSLRVDVDSRLVTVSGLAENRLVAVLDMQGRVVATARAHGASVGLTVPRAGRYIVRSGPQTRLVTVR